MKWPSFKRSTNSQKGCLNLAGFTTTNEKLYNPTRWSLHTMCKAFETDYINVDRYKGNLDLWKLAHRPLERYDFFRNGFIKRDGTPEKNSWDILVDFLEMNHLG